MQLYFVKATYDNNVYKVSDFFLAGDYKQIAGKMLDINFRPDDGLSSFITREITLPDATSIRDHTHIIVPDYDKIYKIISIDYLNAQQYNITVDEDALLSQYLELESTDILLNRTNDPALFRGVLDNADLTFKESVVTSSITSDYQTGKWALLFFQIDTSDSILGLNFTFNSKYEKIYAATYAALVAAYPEVTTDYPEQYDYFQSIAFLGAPYLGVYQFQCVYVNGALIWVLFNPNPAGTVYFNTGVGITTAQPGKINETDVLTICLAIPFESDFYSSAEPASTLINYNNFIGPVDQRLIDIKIVNDLFFKTLSYSEVWVGGSATLNMKKTITWQPNSAVEVPLYSDAGATTTRVAQNIVAIWGLKNDIDISADYIPVGGPEPRSAEPFYKYDLYVFGQRYPIPYYLSDDIHLLIGINSGVVNYIIYYNNKRNILASGAFTHSIKYQIDQLDAFYSQNPTYKDQFFTKMAVDSIKTVTGAAIAGSVIPGLGTLAGAGVGVVGAGVDAGLSMLNLHFQEKGLRMKPDQMFGENSEVSLQVINILGIYWVKRTPENLDLMRVEYDLRGFPTSKEIAIDDLDYTTNDTFPPSKIVFGELKTVIKNGYTTAFINAKLAQGIILIA